MYTLNLCAHVHTTFLSSYCEDRLKICGLNIKTNTVTNTNTVISYDISVTKENAILVVICPHYVGLDIHTSMYTYILH